MKDRPILFSAPMVRAILEGRKTMTRRVIKLKDLTRHPDGDKWYKDRVWSWRVRSGAWTDHTHDSLLSLCPHGQPGDRLWVRETWTYDNKEYVQTYKDEPWRGMPDIGTAEVYYRATERTPDAFPRWRPSIFMPRWASRITLEITNVRVERLNDISEEDAECEGISSSFGNWKNYTDQSVVCQTSKASFRTLWESINGPGSWDANPLVWVVEFKRSDNG